MPAATPTFWWEIIPPLAVAERSVARDGGIDFRIAPVDGQDGGT
jgi:hypothetical protein